MATFSVKNFEKFQHYKDRSPPWIKLYNELLDDYEFGLLQDASKFHLVAIWLLASRSENKIPYDPAWVARRINASGTVNLDALAAGGFIVVDQPLRGAEQDASTPQAECLSREEGQVQDIDKHIDQEIPSDEGTKKTDRSPKKSPKRKPKVPITPVPDGERLNALMLEFLVQADKRRIGVAEAKEQFERFIDHHRSKANEFADWNAAGRNWLRNSPKFSPKPGTSGGGGQRANGGFTQFLVNRAEQTNGTVTIDHDDLEFTHR